MLPCIIFFLIIQGCNDSIDQQESDAGQISFINVHTSVDSQSTESVEGNAVLLFWNEETFHGEWMNKDSNALPWFVSTLDNDIDYYKFESGITFNTKYEYPLKDDATIHATGYFPSNALAPKESKDYTTLMVQNGFNEAKTDFMTCDGCLDHSASRNYPFTLEQNELEFRHLTACIRLLGKRDESMNNIVGVKNVRIKIHNTFDDHNDGYNGLYIPTVFSLYTDNFNDDDKTNDKTTYIVDGYSKAPDLISIDYLGKINMGEERELGACYIVPLDINYTNESEDYYVDPFGEKITNMGSGKPKIKIDVTADFYSISGGETAFTTETWEGLVIDDSKWESCATGNKFIPGYRYDILLHFNRSGVTVKAEAVPWNDGGIHVHPVQPSTSVTP